MLCSLAVTPTVYADGDELSARQLRAELESVKMIERYANRREGFATFAASVRGLTQSRSERSAEASRRRRPQ